MLSATEICMFHFAAWILHTVSTTDLLNLGV